MRGRRVESSLADQRARQLRTTVTQLLGDHTVQDVVRALVAGAGEGGDNLVLTAAAGEQPMPEVLQALALHYGEVVMLGSIAALLQRYAIRGAEARLAEREGNPEIDCPRCRRRDAELRKIEAVTRRTTTGRPIGGGAPEENEGEERDDAPRRQAVR